MVSWTDITGIGSCTSRTSRINWSLFFTGLVVQCELVLLYFWGLVWKVGQSGGENNLVGVV